MSYVWRTDWRWNYESIWGTFEKFKYANTITTGDLIDEVNAKSKRNTIYVNESMYACNNYINITSLNNLLKMDIFMKSRVELKRFLGSIYNGPDIRKYTIKKLRYCPECIKLGYHSMLHQLVFLDNCPFHNITLYSKCPNCKKESSYIIEFNRQNEAFKCSCGYNYLSDNSPLEIFKLWESNKLKNPSLSTKSIDNSKISQQDISYIFPSFTWYLDTCMQSKLYHKTCKLFYNSLIEKNNPYKVNVGFKYSFRGGTVPKFSDKLYDKSGFIMMDEYMQIAKSIARQIRRSCGNNSLNKFYRKLRSYYYYDFFKGKLSKEGLSYKQINAELFAYIMWRKEVEGHNHFNTIHTKLKNRSSDDPLFSIKRNVTGTLFYKYIVNEFNIYLESYRNNEHISILDYGLLVEALERIMGILLIKHYTNWLSYALNMKENHPNKIIDFESTICPPIIDFFVVFNRDSQSAQLNTININE